MRERDEQGTTYLPLMRRLIILAVVLISVPVVLLTIVAFVRSYVGPPNIPTFRQITAMVEASGKSKSDTGGILQWAEAKLSAPSGSAVETKAKTKATETRSAAAPAKDSVPLSDRLPSTDSNPVTGGTRVTDASPVAMVARPTDMPPAAAARPDAMTPNAMTPNGGAPVIAAAKLDATTPNFTTSSVQPMTAAGKPDVWPPPLPTANTAPKGAAPGVWPPAAQKIAAVSEPVANTAPAATPLSGKIPLPRHRPSDLAMAKITTANVPMPRPRPDAAGSAAVPSAETTSAAPLDFLQNLFH